MKTLGQILTEVARPQAAYNLVASKTQGSRWAGKVFLAGGAVRDKLLGKIPKDLDYVVNSPNGGIKFAVWLAKELRIYKAGSNPVIYPRFGTAKLTLRGIKYQGVNLSNVDLEFVMSRTEKYDKKTRKPKVAFGTPKQDAMRRDLTINALMRDITNGKIVDFTGKGISAGGSYCISTAWLNNPAYCTVAHICRIPLRIIRHLTDLQRILKSYLFKCTVP